MQPCNDGLASGAPIGAGGDGAVFSAVLTPHRSLGRRGLLTVLGAFAVLWAGIGVYCWWLGAWPVAGFAGLDFAAVTLALALNNRAARAYETVALSRSRLEIGKVGPVGERRDFVFDPRRVRLSIDKIPDEGVTAIAVCARDMRLPVGAFLNPPDRESFARAFDAALAEARR